MYTLLPPMEPHRRIETVLPNTELPLTKNQLVQNYLLKTSSKKDNYYVDIDAKPTHVITTPIPPKPKMVENGSPAKPQAREKFKTTVTQTLPNYQDSDCPTRSNTKRNITSHKVKASSPKIEKKVQEVEKAAEKKGTETESGHPKLKEICFIKNSFGKQMIAKYNSKNGDSPNNGEDNLIIVWNEQNKAQLLTYKGKDPRRYAMVHCLPHEKSSFRVHDFSKRSGGGKRTVRRRKG